MFECLFTESIVAVFEFYELNYVFGEGIIGVWFWCGTFVMHRMYGVHFAWHWHIVCARVHISSHSRIVEFGGLLLKFHALIIVKN